jgi:hypothetical protein
MLSCRSINDSMRSCFWASRIGNHLIIYMALVYTSADRNWLWKYGKLGRDLRDMTVMRSWFGRIPARWNFRSDEFSVQQRHSSVSHGGISVDRTRSTSPWRFRELFPSNTLCFRFFFCMTEWTFAFDSSCPTIWRAPFSSEQTGWLDFLFSLLSTSQRFGRTLLHLTRHACVQWLHHGMG